MNQTSFRPITALNSKLHPWIAKKKKKKRDAKREGTQPRFELGWGAPALPLNPLSLSLLHSLIVPPSIAITQSHNHSRPPPSISPLHSSPPLPSLALSFPHSFLEGSKEQTSQQRFYNQNSQNPKIQLFNLMVSQPLFLVYLRHTHTHTHHKNHETNGVEGVTMTSVHTSCFGLQLFFFS